MLHEQSEFVVIKVKMLRFCLPLLIAHVSGFKFVNVGPGCGVSNPFINIWTQASLQKKWYKRCLMLHKDFEYQGVKLLGKGTFPKHPNYIKKLKVFINSEVIVHVGPRPEPGGNLHETLEVINIHEHNFTCPEIPPYPLTVPSGAGITERGLVACGGFLDDVFQTQCYALSPLTNEWEPVFSMPWVIKENARVATADNDGFLIIGGFRLNPYQRLNKVFKVTAAGVSSAGYTLTTQFQSCVAKINSSHALLVGRNENN